MLSRLYWWGHVLASGGLCWIFCPHAKRTQVDDRLLERPAMR